MILKLALRPLFSIAILLLAGKLKEALLARAERAHHSKKAK